MAQEQGLEGRVAFVTGAARGQGRAYAVRLAQEGADVIISDICAPVSPTIPYAGATPDDLAETVRLIETEGRKVLARQVDIRDDQAVQDAVNKAVETFGGIDICINNASALFLRGTLDTPMKRYDLMHQINTRGTFLVSQTCLPHLLKASNPHILNLSPPLNLSPHWFAPHVAYTMAKYGMSMCVLGMAEEFRGQVAVNALWPRTAIATAAVKNVIGGDELMNMSRKPEIMADAAWHILTQPHTTCTGNFFIDDEVLEQAGITDFDQYAVVPGAELAPDFFL
jgi:citronellol/citronellal dehydrogenase